MAGEAQLTAEERAEVQAQLLDIRKKLTPPGATQPAAWQKVADALNAKGEDDQVTGETLRKLGDLGVGGAKAARAIRRYLGIGGETRTVERDERYPAKRVAAALLRGLISDEAIDAMLSEEYRGGELNPSEEFFIARGRFFEKRRLELKAELQPPPVPAELARPLPMEGRPKKKGRTR